VRRAVDVIVNVRCTIIFFKKSQGQCKWQYPPHPACSISMGPSRGALKGRRGISREINLESASTRRARILVVSLSSKHVLSADCATWLWFWCVFICICASQSLATGPCSWVPPGAGGGGGAPGHHAHDNGHGHVRVYARLGHIKRTMHGPD
jgi:hypothetical protein